MNYDNLKIQATLRTPVISDAYLPIDGILFALMVRNDLGEKIVSISGASILTEEKGLPLKGTPLPIQKAHAKDWYYKSSWAQWGQFADGQEAWTKRIDQNLAYMIDFRGKRGSINISSAEYKAYHMPVYYRSANLITWYCVADYDAINELLPYATHIGKKTVQGWGRVASWKIEKMDHDYSVWQEDKLMRGIPPYHNNKLQNPKRGIYGVRPPYWDRRNQMELIMP